MQYILTQQELDELKNKPRVTAKEFLAKFSEYVIAQKVCIDVNIGTEYVVSVQHFKAAIQKTLEYYDTQNS